MHSMPGSKQGGESAREMASKAACVYSWTPYGFGRVRRSPIATMEEYRSGSSSRDWECHGRNGLVLLAYLEILYSFVHGNRNPPSTTHYNHYPLPTTRYHRGYIPLLATVATEQLLPLCRGFMTVSYTVRYFSSTSNTPSQHQVPLSLTAIWNIFRLWKMLKSGSLPTSPSFS